MSRTQYNLKIYYLRYKKRHTFISLGKYNYERKYRIISSELLMSPKIPLNLWPKSIYLQDLKKRV